MMARPVCEEKSREMVSSSTTGFCYSDVSSSSGNMQTNLVNQIQAAAGFVSDPEMFNLTTGMEMIGFSKNLQQSSDSDTNALMWKSFFGNKHGHGQHPAAGPSSSKTINESSTTTFYHDYNNNNNNKPDFTSGISETTSADQNLILGAHHHHHHDSTQVQAWQDHNSRANLLVDDSSLRCVFPCEGNERPSQGLSLSLSSSNPSSIGLQSFELRQTSHHHHHNNNQPHVDFVSSSSSREGFYGKSSGNNNAPPHQQHMLQAPSSSSSSSLYQGHHFVLKNSKYLLPAQELLNEFCSLGIRQTDAAKQKSNNKKQWEEEDNGGAGTSGSSKKHTLTSLEFVELQKRKTKLLSMLEELDRRYKHYRNQMKAVVSSFEAVAGNGAATVYSALALKAMSKYFRNLKDAIMGQIQATRKAMGEKDPVAPGTTRGETPRLKVIDQAMRQQRAFQQMTMMETHPWRPQRGLPERSVSVLRAWLFEHFLHPYPSDVDKHILARQTGLSRSQVSNWFINARVRLWKPMVEEMYTEELKEQEKNMGSSEGGATDPDLDDTNQNQNAIHHHNQAPSSRSEDQKPTPDRLVMESSECATSILNHHENKNDQCLGRVTDTFGSVELDFSSYTQQQGFSSSGGGVSLTLGLQQHGHGHGGNGVSIAFPGSSQSSLFYGREQIEDCTQPAAVVHHQYSLLDGEAQNHLPYRNLMGAQLLHDLAG